LSTPFQHVRDPEEFLLQSQSVSPPVCPSVRTHKNNGRSANRVFEISDIERISVSRKNLGP